MLKLTIVLAVVALAAAQMEKYDGYKVFKVTPSNKEQTDLLHKLAEYNEEYSFWNGPTFPNITADMMVAPEKVNKFKKMMRTTGMQYEAFIDDVQALIDTENPPAAIRYGRLLDAGFDFTRYHTIDEIYAFLDSLAESYPDKVEVVVGGQTYEGRQIKGVKLSFKKNNPGIFIEGGIHAREWISTATVTYILNELLHSQNPDVRYLAENNDWYIFPVFNPDGFVYTHATDRLWRKTRKPYGFMCHGSDPNRNWGYRWMEDGAISHPCAETFAGSAPFSEIETQSLSQYITSISDKIYAYISFHSFRQLLLFPYGHTTEHLENYDELYAIGKKAIEALAERYGTRYVTGNIAETIYVATGGSGDWVKGTFKTPLVYTYELRDTGRYGFLLPANQIIPTGEETLDSLVALFKEARVRGIPKNTSDTLANTYDQGRYGFLLPASQIIPTGEETLDSLVPLFKEAGVRGIPKRQ